MPTWRLTRLEWVGNLRETLIQPVRKTRPCRSRFPFAFMPRFLRAVVRGGWRRRGSTDPFLHILYIGGTTNHLMGWRPKPGGFTLRGWHWAIRPSRWATGLAEAPMRLLSRGLRHDDRPSCSLPVGETPTGTGGSLCYPSITGPGLQYPGLVRRRRRRWPEAPQGDIIAVRPARQKNGRNPFWIPPCHFSEM